MPERKLDRVATIRSRGDERPSNDDLAGSTPAGRIGMVWPLTKTVWAFKEAGERSRDENNHAREDETPRAERRLSRHLVRLRRSGG
jgi:hypothetical protein